jgi:hypothetical protein
MEGISARLGGGAKKNGSRVAAVLKSISSVRSFDVCYFFSSTEAEGGVAATGGLTGWLVCAGG